MLRYLRLENLAVVREASIELGEGLIALTGETGAGKSIMVDALTLLLLEGDEFVDELLEALLDDFGLEAESPSGSLGKTAP